MKREQWILLALLGGLLCSACEAIDDFNPYHVVTSDGDGALAGDGGGDLADGAVAANADLLAPVPDMTQLNCVSTLAGSGTKNFTVRLRLITTADPPTDGATLLFQRSACTSDADYWDLRVDDSGLLTIKLLAGAVYTKLTTAMPVNNGVPHYAVVQRKGGMLTIFTDGLSSGSTSAGQDFAALPPLGIAKGNPWETDPRYKATPLDGTLSDVCITVE